MQLIKFELNHPNLFCPVTGRQIQEDTYFNDDVPSVMGYWLDRYWEAPVIKCEKLKKAWEDYLRNGGEAALEKGCIESDRFYPLEIFFHQVNMDNVLVIRLDNKNRRYSAPVPYIVLNMDYHEEEEEEVEQEVHEEDEEGNH